MHAVKKDIQYYKFCAYGFFKNLRFFEIFFLLYLKETGLSYTSIGFLYSIRQIVINLMEIPSGLLADSFGRKRALLFSFFAYILSFLIFYISNHFYLLSLAMIFFGFGEAFRSGTHKAIILSYLRQKNLLALKSRYYGSTRSWSQLGSAVVALLSAAFIFWGTAYRTLFIITLVPYILDLILISTYPADHTEEVQFSPKILYRAFLNTSRTFMNLFRNPHTLSALFSTAVYIAFFKTIKDYLQPLLKTIAIQIPLLLMLDQDKRSAILFGTVYFVLFLLTSFVSKNAWILEKKFRNLTNPVNLLYLLGVSSIALAGIALYFDYRTVAMIFFLALFLVQNARRPLMLSLLSERIDSRIMASGLSAESQLETLLVALLAPGLGWLTDLYGLSGGLFFISLLFILFFPLVRLRNHRS